MAPKTLSKNLSTLQTISAGAEGCADFKTIILPSGHEVLLDAEDYEKVQGYRWWLGCSRGVYDCRVVVQGKLLFIHRVI